MHKAEVHKIRDTFIKKGHNFITFGNSERGVSFKELDYVHYLASLASPERINYFVVAHGDVADGSYKLINTSGGRTEKICISELFSSITNYLPATDVTLLTCHAGAAAVHFDKLPLGSTLTTMAAGKELLSSNDVSSFFESLNPDKSLSPIHLVTTMLCSAENRIHPAIYSGCSSIKLSEQLLEGGVLKRSEKKIIHKRLQDYLSDYNIKRALELHGIQPPEYLGDGQYLKSLAIVLHQELMSKSWDHMATHLR